MIIINVLQDNNFSIFRKQKKTYDIEEFSESIEMKEKFDIEEFLKIYDLLEEISGQRMNNTFFRFGGCFWNM